MAVRRSSLKDYESKKRRRKTTLATRTRYSKPSASNQKKQILTLAKKVRRNTSLLRQQRVYTDYQWGQTVIRGMYADCISGTWHGWKITDVHNSWQPCLRQDINTAASSRTFAKRVQLNCRAEMGTASNICYMNVFLVTCRSDFIGGITVTDNVGGMTQLVDQEDFIEQSFNETANIRLNSGRFKVHACKYMTLLPNTGAAPLPASASVGDPASIWRKWQWNLPLNFTIRNPSNHPWSQVEFDNMPFYEKYFIIVYCGAIPSDGKPKFMCDALATCINYS